MSSLTPANDSSTAQGQNLLSRVQQLTSDLQNTQAQLRVTEETEREATDKVHKLVLTIHLILAFVMSSSVRALSSESDLSYLM